MLSGAKHLAFNDEILWLRLRMTELLTDFLGRVRQQDNIFILFRIFLILSMLITVFPDVFAADARESLKVPIDSLYTQMLGMAQKGEFDKLAKAVEIVSPVLEETKENTEIDVKKGIESALESKDNKKVLKSVESAIAMGVVSLLKMSHEKSKDDAAVRKIVKQAYTEYVTIDPSVKEKDFKASQEININFRKANTLAGGKPEEYLATCKQISAKLETLFAGGAGGGSAGGGGSKKEKKE